MPYDELRRFREAQPFVPFRIRTTDGQQFEVRHPEMMALFRHVAVIGVPEEGANEGVSLVSVAVIHVVTVQPVRPGG